MLLGFAMILAPVFVQLLTATVLLVLRRARPRFSNYWVIATLGALTSWALLWLLPLIEMPAQSVGTWQAGALFTPGLQLALDSAAWSYALALSTLVLAVILTDVARAFESDWASWAAILGLSALGTLTVMAGNLFSLLLGWAAIDLIELVVLLVYVTERRASERVVVAFFARALGSVVVVGAALVAIGGWPWPSALDPDSQAGLLLLIAAGLRLGVLPLHLPFLQEPPLRRGLGTVVRLVPAAASLVLLARLTGLSLAPPIGGLMIGLLALAAVYGGIAWGRSADEMDGRPFWILGLASLSLVSALHGQTQGSQTWGVTLILAGGLLFLYSARARWLLFVPVLGLMAISSLPFTPTWSSTGVYTTPLHPLVYAFLIAQAVLLLGYWRHTRGGAQSLPEGERLVQLIYPIGLILLPAVNWILAYQDWPARDLAQAALWWPGLAVTGLAGGLGWVWSRRQLGRLPGFAFLGRALSLDWLYRLFWAAYRLIGRAVVLLTSVLEREGGVLWALLLLTLLLALLAQANLGEGLVNGS